MSLEIFGPGTSTRNSWTSPRPRSSSSKTSLSPASAGTSCWKSTMAFSTWALVSGEVTAISDLVALQELASDDHALDLRGALADQQQRRVAVEPLDLVLLGVAIAAVDPEGVLDDLFAGLGREQLRHAGLEVRALARVLHAGRLEGEQPRGLDLRGHVGELELDRLVLGDRLAERLALLAVAQTELQRALRDPDAAGRDVDAADLQCVHHLAEALAQPGLLAPQDHVGRALVAVEDQL